MGHGLFRRRERLVAKDDPRWALWVPHSTVGWCVWSGPSSWEQSRPWGRFIYVSIDIWGCTTQFSFSICINVFIYTYCFFISINIICLILTYKCIGNQVSPCFMSWWHGLQLPLRVDKVKAWGAPGEMLEVNDLPEDKVVVTTLWYWGS